MTTHAASAAKKSSFETSNRRQLSLFRDVVDPFAFDGSKHATFRQCKAEPIHRWYPYLEGYGPEFVRSIAATYMPSAQSILEPFAGSGTTPLALGTLGITCGYCEANPVLREITRIKFGIAHLPESQRAALSHQISTLAEELPTHVSRSTQDMALKQSYQACFDRSVFFDESTFASVLNLRSLVDKLKVENSHLADALTLSILAKLVICSNLKRAGDVRFKTESELELKPGSIVKEIQGHLNLIAQDCFSNELYVGNASLICEDARQLEALSSFHADGVITSPPYINGTNYIRNTKLELWFQRDLRVSLDLRKFRDMVVTAGINDVAGNQDYEPVSDSVALVVDELKKDAYDQRIPLMVAAYFADMLKVFRGIHRHTNPNAVVCIDIGDSKYGGVHVPTHSLLADVASLAGFNLETAIPLRTRLSKDKTPLTQVLLYIRA
jgi:DNA modification methylase